MVDLKPEKLVYAKIKAKKKKKHTHTHNVFFNYVMTLSFLEKVHKKSYREYTQSLGDIRSHKRQSRN